MSNEIRVVTDSSGRTIAVARMESLKYRIPSGGYVMQPTNSVIYARVSSDEQRERQTIENQIDVATKYCERHGYTIVATYRDEAISGTLPFDERPSGLKLLNDARNNRFDVVVVYRVDRMARNTRDLLSTAERLKEMGVQLQSATEPFDTGTPTGNFMLTMLGSVATLERQTILERTALGLSRNARAGKWNGGKPPYGYRLDDHNHLLVHENEAAVVREIFTMYNAGTSSAAIVDHLNAHGVPKSEIGAKGNSRWNITQIGRILRKTCYAGTLTYGTRSPGKEITSTVPAIVSEEMWERARELRKKNKILAKRNSKRVYLLRDKIICGSCGRKYSGMNPTHAKNSYYRCLGKATSYQYVNPRPACESKNLVVDEIESIVWEDIKRYLQHPEEVIREIERREKDQDADAKSQGEKRDELSRLLVEKEAERKRAISLFTKGLITEKDAEDELRTVNAEINVLKAEAAEIEERARRVYRVRDDADRITSFLKSLESKIGKADRKLKKQIVDILVEGIVIDTEVDDQGHKQAKAKITYRFGDPDLVNSDTRGKSRVW